MNCSLTNVFRLQVLAVVGVLSMAVAGPAAAQDSENPFKRGAYWSVTGIHVNDGSGLKYANHLANNWVRSQEFAKSKGWISGYHILSNAYPREGEPDIYLVTIFKEMTSAEEDDKRSKDWLEFNKSTMAKMQAESGERAEYRTVGGDMLLTEMMKR